MDGLGAHGWPRVGAAVLGGRPSWLWQTVGRGLVRTNLGVTSHLPLSGAALGEMPPSERLATVMCRQGGTDPRTRSRTDGRQKRRGGRPLPPRARVEQTVGPRARLASLSFSAKAYLRSHKSGRQGLYGANTLIWTNF